MTPNTTTERGGYDRSYDQLYDRGLGPQPEIAMRGGPEGATLGGPYAAFRGPQRPADYRLRITTGAGDRHVIERFESLGVTRRHTAISDWSATIAHDPGIDDRVLSSVRLTWGDTILFQGRLQNVDGGLGEPVVKLEGEGIETDLTRGDIDLDLTNVRRCDAIRTVWRWHTPFDATIYLAAGPGHPCATRISTDPNDGEYSGTPMEVLKELHNDAGMRFTVLHSRPGLNVESYPIGGRQRRHDWDVDLDESKRQVSAEGYANRVVVRGALRGDGSGERIVEVATDDAEIAAMKDRQIGNDGVVTYPIGPDDEFDTHEKARAEAESKLAELVDRDSVGGKLEITPTVAAPGLDYYVPEFSGEREEPLGASDLGNGPLGTVEGRYVSLEQVTYSIKFGTGERSCSLDLTQRDGLVDELGKLYGGA